MKCKYFLLTIFLYLNCNKSPRNFTGFIEFVHTGITTRITTPLFISTKKIEISLSKSQIDEFRHSIGDTTKITKQREEEYINLKFDRIVTDSLTCSSINEFILKNKQYYTDDAHQNKGVWESYNIHLNDLKFSIYFKIKIDFFRDLETFLKERKCDKRVIIALSHL